MSSVFRSLSNYNFRIWSAGALVSNIGTWMQRTAQDWVVLTHLTHHDAAAVGIVMALQFGPQLLMLPLSGLIADRFDQRTVLKFTQGTMGALALALGILTVTDLVQLWEVYLFALLLGCTQAVDSPVRLTFVSQLVGRANLSNAVGLNSTSFNLARTVGPAVAGVMIGAIGSGWVFLANFVSFGAVLTSLFLIRKSDLVPVARAKASRAALSGGFRYLRTRPDIILVLVVMFIFGTFGVNFPIFISTMATVVYHSGATGFGVLSSIIAIGSVLGALLTARRERPRLRYVFVATAVFGAICAVSALAPGYWWFAASIVIMGFAAQTVTTTANSYVQLSTPAEVRGRVMAIYMAVFAGGTPIGAPIVGWVANEFGPRVALGVGSLAGVVCAAIILAWFMKYRGLRVRFVDRRFALSYGARNTSELLVDEMAPLKG
jgi:MFS family permease